MSMFRRPTDDSSDSDSSSEESDAAELQHSDGGTENSHASAEEVIGADLTTINTLSSGESISVEHSREDAVIGDIEHVRNMMLASLLEDFYRTRAAELLNAANPGANLHRQSPEVQNLARRLFAQASQAMTSNGLLPVSTLSDAFQGMRGQYLAGFDHFGLSNIKIADLNSTPAERKISASHDSLALVKAATLELPYIQSTKDHPVRDLALRTGRLSIIPHPAIDMQLSSIPSSHSHYKSSFQEMRFLGRGGFGRVYQTYNLFDKKEYAVKKIPLSPKLSQQYREKGHLELSSILREVQALAQLDHHNVVRYHATWIEDPTVPLRHHNPPSFRSPFNAQKFIADRPAALAGLESPRRSSGGFLSYGASDGIKFEVDSPDESTALNKGLEWSHHSSIRPMDSSIQDTDIFTDGMANHMRTDNTADDPTCYVLHVQMSMYPVTLAQYLSAAPSSLRRGSLTLTRRHCFHLVPALRILLGILCGLQYIHSRGLIHRDIKPSNIFLSNYEVDSRIYSSEGYHDVGMCPSCPARHPYHINPRIGDFGLVADLAQDNKTFLGSNNSCSSAVGTEYYRPPSGKGKKPASAVDEKLDVYALGVVFVELLWRCGTTMERMSLLGDVQRGKIPRYIIDSIEAEGYYSGAGNAVETCITGMIDLNHSTRWTCAEVKECLEGILAKCQGEHLDTGQVALKKDAMPFGPLDESDQEC